MTTRVVSIVAAALFAGCSTRGEESVRAPDIPIHEAFKAGNIEAVRQHIHAGTDVNAKGPNAGLTPLHRAAYCGLKEIVELLLAKGAKVNATEEVGWTPLHYAAAMRYDEIVELLLANGADANAKDVGGDTPLLPIPSASITGRPDVGGTHKILKESPRIWVIPTYRIG